MEKSGETRMAPNKKSPTEPVASMGEDGFSGSRASQLLELDVHFWFSVH